MGDISIVEVDKLTSLLQKYILIIFQNHEAISIT